MAPGTTACGVLTAAPAVRRGAYQPSRRQWGCQHCLKASEAPGRRARKQAGAFTCRASGSSSEDESPASTSGSGIPDALPVASSGTDWRQFRAQLVASSLGATSSAAPKTDAAVGGAPWAHPLARPEQGCLLLANPLMFATSQTYFHMGVIFIWAHDSQGSAGLILNRPTEYLVSHFGKGAGFLTPEFDTARLHLGGDVGADTVHLLHSVEGLQSSSEIIPGVYLGGFDAAKQGVAQGRYDVSQFRIFTRYAGWGPGQLEAECQRGVWLPMSASSDVVLRPTDGGRAGTEAWHHIAQLAGGDMAALSREVQGVPNPEIARAANGGNLGSSDTSGCGGGSSCSGGLGTEGEEAGAGWDGGERARRRAQQQQRRRRPEGDYRDGAGI